jgi:hypothetical protein
MAEELLKPRRFDGYFVRLSLIEVGLGWVGLVGREGAVGLSIVLGATTSPLDGVVQVEGEILQLPASELQAALADAPSLLGILRAGDGSLDVEDGAMNWPGSMASRSWCSPFDDPNLERNAERQWVMARGTPDSRLLCPR